MPDHLLPARIGKSLTAKTQRTQRENCTGQPLCSLCLCGESLPPVWLGVLPGILLALVLLSACARTPIPTAPPATLTVSGSSAMAPLLGRLAARFRQEHPSVMVTVDQRDSALGLTDVVSGRAALGAVSAAPPESVWNAPIAVDGIAVIVHPDNSLTDLTMAQLQDVFSGRVWQWHELGVTVAVDEIQVVSREEGSGTRLSFEALVMREDLPALGDCPAPRLPDPGVAIPPITPTPAPACALSPVTSMAVVVMNSQAAVEFVSQNPGAIAYVSRSYLNLQARARQVVSTVRIEGAPPDLERIYRSSRTDPAAPAGADSQYPLTQPFFLVAPQEPAGAARLFVDFCLGAPGQAVVAEQAVPVRR